MIQGLAEHKLHASERRTFLDTLWGLAGRHARLPVSMVIAETIDFSTPTQPPTTGGFADIKPGRYKECTVAVKALRVAASDNFDKIRKVSWRIFVVGRDNTEVASQQFCKEAILWNSLSHPNILKLVGVLGGFEQYQFATVSEWMVHGTIMEYIRKYATNRLELVRVSVFQGEGFVR